MATILCECGAVCLEILGTSMMSVVCHCRVLASPQMVRPSGVRRPRLHPGPSVPRPVNTGYCRTAGREFDARSRVAPIVDINGGTPVVLWRKDRVNCLRGCERLKAYRLTAESLSRRMVASCCETPMFGDFTEGFWISIYRGRIPDAPLPSMRVMTSDMPAGLARTSPPISAKLLR